MKGKCKSVEKVWTDIKFWFSSITNNMNKVEKLSLSDGIILQELHIPAVLPRPKRIRVVNWLKLREGRFKLNSDKCTLANLGSAGAGGVIRGPY